MKKFRKCTGLIMVLVMLLSMTAPVLAADHTFKDVPQLAWYESYVDYTVQEGLFQGVTSDFFEPDRSLTREELITVLQRMYKKTGDEASPSVDDKTAFSDVSEGRYSYDAILWAEKTGLVDGYPDGTFRPKTPVDRQTLAALMYRYLTLVNDVELQEPVDWFCTEYSHPEPIVMDSYADAEQIAGWASEAVSGISNFRIMIGIQSGDKVFFQPDRQATRAETAAVLTRVYQALFYTADSASQYDTLSYSVEEVTSILQGKDYEIVSSSESLQSLLDRIHALNPDYTASERWDASFFETGNLLAVELQSVGSPLFRSRLTNCAVTEDTAKLTFLTDAHGFTADVRGDLYLIEVPKSVTQASMQTVYYVHAIPEIILPS